MLNLLIWRQDHLVQCPSQPCFLCLSCGLGFLYLLCVLRCREVRRNKILVRWSGCHPSKTSIVCQSLWLDSKQFRSKFLHLLWRVSSSKFNPAVECAATEFCSRPSVASFGTSENFCEIVHDWVEALSLLQTMSKAHKNRMATMESAHLKSSQVENGGLCGCRPPNPQFPLS